MPDDDRLGRAAPLDRQAERARTTPERLIGEAERRAKAEGGGQSEGVPAKGRLEAHSYSPTGGPAIQHWQEGRVSRPGLDDRGDVFFAAVEMTRMPMIVTDPNRPDNPIAFANGAFLDLTGYSRDEIYGRNCRFLQGALTDRGTVRQIREAVAEPRPVAVEILNYRKDGTPFWNALFVGPVFDRQGKLLYFFASQLDVTRRRNSEDAFRQAQKMEAIGQLTAGLAHDFNNALQVVLGNLKRAEGRLSSDEAEARKALERAGRAGERAARLTKQLLTFARKTRLEPRPMVLNEVLADFGDMLARTLGDALRIEYETDPDLPPCVIDPVHAEMALLNVLANARDAMPGGGKATVRTGTVGLDEAAIAATGDGLRPGRYVLLAVEDDGPGMPPEVLARAAEPFFTTKGGKGTGLGLAMVHGFVRQSGGRLEIRSAPGEGTTVRMLFPAAAGNEAGPPRPSWAEAVLDARSGAETVLVVDDDEDVLDLAVHHLVARGYDVLSARSGEEALRVLESGGRRIDLLFTDIAMPGGINGIVLAGRARAMFPGIKVLLATGYNEDLARGRERDADVLGKPYGEAELADRVRAALNHPDGHRPGAGARHEA